MKRYCKKCKKATTHRKLAKSGFVPDCLVALISGFSVNLREPDYECNDCGNKV